MARKSAGVRFVVPEQWKAWTDGFGEMDRSVIVNGTTLWRAATDIMFDRTQQYVHVLTGQLKSSGVSSVKTYGRQIIGEIEYGNTAVDYAEYERRRGGEHDFFARAYVDSEATFEKMLPQVWEQITSSWKV